MKIALLGVSKSSIELAEYYYELGAYVRIFADPMTDDFKNIPESLVSTVKCFPVVRVMKRYLHKGEQIDGYSRFYDLFRVVFTVKPKESQQAESLREKDLAALQDEIEFYDDVDIVVDCRTKQINRMGPGGDFAINENYHNKKNVDYLNLSTIDLQTIKNLAIVGTENIQDNFDELKEFLSNESKKVFLVSHKSIEIVRNEVNELLSVTKEKFDNNINEFEAKMKEWKALEDYEKVKVPKPVEPVSQLEILAGHTVVSCDRLTDHEHFFLSVEAPEFRGGNGLLRTLNCDAILVKQGTSKATPISFGLNAEEKGFFQLDDNLSKNDIISSIEKLFTRNED